MKKVQEGRFLLSKTRYLDKRMAYKGHTIKEEANAHKGMVKRRKTKIKRNGNN